MPKQSGPLFDYVLRRYQRDERGHFTREQAAETLSQYRRKHAEWHARERSRQHALDLVTLSRDGVILSHLMNGQTVEPQAIVADAAAQDDERASDAYEGESDAVLDAIDYENDDA